MRRRSGEWLRGEGEQPAEDSRKIVEFWLLAKLSGGWLKSGKDFFSTAIEDILMEDLFSDGGGAEASFVDVWPSSRRQARIRDALLPIASTDPSSRAQEKLFNGSAMTKGGAYAAISYMICAVFLVMFNKAALSSYNFPCVNVITLCQMISSSCFLYALRRLNLISFNTNEPVALTDTSKTLVPIETLVKTSPLSLTYLLYMLASMESVRGVNVPMYTTLRRTTVVFTMMLEYILVRQSVALILLGAFIAGAGDLSFDSYGYMVVLLSNITTAVYLTTIARIGISSGLNSFGLMWCNGVLCAPILLMWIIFQNDVEMTINFPYLLSPGFLAVLVMSCILAFFLNYTVFLNTTLNSALTQTICGNMKDFFTVALGWVIFGGLAFDIVNVFGQLLGFIGSVMYAYFKLIGK